MSIQRVEYPPKPFFIDTTIQLIKRKPPGVEPISQMESRADKRPHQISALFKKEGNTIKVVFYQLPGGSIDYLL